MAFGVFLFFFFFLSPIGVFRCHIMDDGLVSIGLPY